MVLCRKLGLEPIFGPGRGKDGADVVAILAQSPSEAQTSSALSQDLNSGANTGMT
jgi:hypothetical protein